MKTRFKYLFMVLALFPLASFNLQLSTAFGQGALMPPGAPLPTMKTLAQIEPRTPISSLPFDIISPGSYYMTTNLTCPSGYSGITIETNDVTIDLNGFFLLGAAGAYHGIDIPNNTTTNITVRNGTISGWSGGYGISGLARNMTLERLTVSANNNGVNVLDNSVVRDCMISGNSQNGLVLNGPGCLVLNNDFAGNNSANGSVNASIAVQAPNNRIEGNHVTGSGPAGKGLYIISNPGVTNNIIIRNSVIGGGANNYALGIGNSAGPLITNTVSGIITNSNPWANFSY